MLPQVETMSDRDYEELTRAFWAARVPDLEDVTVTVRRGERVVRFLLIDGRLTPLAADPAEVRPCA